MFDHSDKIEQSGFTLLEILVAMAIFSFGIFALSSMTVSVIKSNYKSKNMTIAVDLAQNKLDDLRITNYANIVDTTENHLDENGVPVTGGLFNREVTVTSNVNPNYKTVDVTVSWADPNQREITLQTIIAQ
jgi:type II secretion system protein I